LDGLAGCSMPSGELVKTDCARSFCARSFLDLLDRNTGL
jgi:hypothetical protein